MTTRRRAGTGVVLAAALALGGCLGMTSDEIETGLTLHLAEAHGEAKPDEEPLELTGTPDAPGMTGGYDAAAEHHTVPDGTGRLVSLYRAYVVLARPELVPCPSIAALPGRLMDALVPSAYAHAGHGAEPVGGRALDKPNVIDLVTRDDFLLPLGDAATSPGRYCGVRVGPARPTGETYGKPDFAPASADDPTTDPGVPDLAGRAFALRGDYCTATDGGGLCTLRAKVDVDDAGLDLPPAVALDFDAPLVLDGTRREGYVAVGIAYGEWLQGVDAARLASDAGARQALLDAVAASLHVRYAGLGDLPLSVAP
jgi:hypothetical protein